jgi:hypothetical protein
MSLLVKTLFEAFGPSTLREFQRQCATPTSTQQKLLIQLLSQNRDTEYGRAHGFSAISNVRDFQKRVPIVGYEDLRSYIENAMSGAARQLTRRPPIFYAVTSGTTGASKYIPVTPESRTVKSKLVRVWLSAIFRDHAGIFAGRILQVASPEVEGRTASGVPYGAESGHAYRNMPGTMKKMYSVPYETYEIKDYDAKYYTTLRLAAGDSISTIASVNPSSVLLLAKRLAGHTEHILRDIRDGTLRTDLDIDPRIRRKLERGLRPDPERASKLERATRETGGKLLPKGAWPDMEIIACWKGGTVGQYLEQFDDYFPFGIATRDLGYLSSENRGSVPLTDEGDSGVLAIATNFYEFFPEDASGQPDGPDLLTAEELEVGRRYFIYVTTLGGLYRYDMNDIVEVTGHYQGTPLIRFVQKGKGVVSFTGEKLYETQVLAAAGKAFTGMSQRPELIAAVGEMHGDRPRYVFLVEFDVPPSDSEGTELAGRLELALCESNIEYAAKRDSMRIGPTVLRVVRSGEFDAYRRRMVEQGRADGQFKVLRLTSDTSFAQEFSSISDYAVAS